MKEAIQRWLTRSLGVVVDLNDTTFIDKTRDGKLLSDLLCSYNIISEPQSDLVEKTDNIEIAYSNFSQHIVGWLRNINVYVSHSEILDIINGRGSASLNLFFKVYLELINKSKISFELNQRCVEKLRPKNFRFKVQTVKDDMSKEFELADHPASKYLHRGWDVINWYQDKFVSLTNTIKEKNDEYNNFIKNKIKTSERPNLSINKAQEKAPKIPLNLPTEDDDAEFDCSIPYEVLKKEQEKAKQAEIFHVNKIKARNILKEIKVRHQFDAENGIYKDKLQKDVTYRLWVGIQEKHESEVIKFMNEKLLKQSMYEKQMVTKLLETQTQKKIMMENRIFVNKEEQKQKELEFARHFAIAETQISDQKNNYYFERDRLNELHKRLYEEKQRLKRAKHEQFCRETVNALIDYSLIHVDYSEKYKTEPKTHELEEWKTLFIKSSQLLPALDSVDDIIQYKPELPEEIEELYNIETERQNALDDQMFDNYLFLKAPFELDSVEYTEEELHKIEMGCNILGYIIHSLLLAKYPLDPPSSGLNMPNLTTAVCMAGITDETIIPTLKKILEKSKIKVVELHEAINFCIEAYKQEVKPEDYVDNRVNQAQSEEAILHLENAKKPSKHKKDGKSKNKRRGNVIDAASKSASLHGKDSDVCLPRAIDKVIQTPKWLPGDEIYLSQTAELGKTAFEELNLGNPLTDFLVADMLIEYLKTLHNFQGFALVNIPHTIEEMVFLEEKLTGAKVPNVNVDVKYLKSIVDLLDLSTRQSDGEADKDILRSSELLPNPVKPLERVPFKTFLTAYIKILQQVTDTDRGSTELPPVTEYFETPPDQVCKFYAEQGCLYYLYYKVFDFDAVKHLGKLIIGDYTLPLKDSVTLFGDNLQEIGTQLDQYRIDLKSKAAKIVEEEKIKEKSKKIIVKKKGDEKKTSKKSVEKKSDKKGKASGKEKGKNKTKKGEEKITLTYDDKDTQIPEPEEEEEDIIIEYIEEPKPPLPGEPGWIYIDLPVPHSIQVLLATLWEHIEENYVSGFKAIFFMKRVALNALMPYTHAVNNLMNKLICAPDNKQLHLFEFQLLYNSIDADLRDDEEMKAELHCRIDEFRQNLCEVCDRNMQASEERRLQIIRDNWLIIQIIEVINLFTNAYQLELDRCTDSLQLVNDYYSAIITGAPNEAPKLQKITLPKQDVQDANLIRRLSENLNIFLERFQDVKSVVFESQISPINKLFANNIGKLKTDCFKVIDNLISSKKKKDSKKVKATAAVPDEQDYLIRENLPKLTSEWKTVVEGEIARAMLRVNILYQDAVATFLHFTKCLQNVFFENRNKIEEKYRNELSSVQAACDVLSRAVEEEVPIEPKLIIEGDKFYVEPNEKLFEKIPYLDPDPLAFETIFEDKFSIKQLMRIVDLFMGLAPSGLLPERAFVYSIQDLITNNPGEGGLHLIPDRWLKLTPNNVNQLCGELFDKNEYIYWKDFIIYNLQVPYPAEFDIINFRAEVATYDPDITETVKDYQFKTMVLWFENYIETSHINQLKALLFKMYRINEDTINYTAMMLDFCKDNRSILGLVKAVELATGKYVCWEELRGEEYVTAIYHERNAAKDKLIFEKIQKKRQINTIRVLLNEIVDQVVHECDSVILQDVTSEPNTPSAGEKNEDNNQPISSLASIQIEDQIRFDKKDKDNHVVLFSDERIKNYEQQQNNLPENIETTSTTLSSSVISETECSLVNFPAEADRQGDTDYFVDFVDILNVITAALPWHARVQNIEDRSFREIVEDIYDSCRRTDFDNQVLAHEFFNNAQLKNLIRGVHKFSVRDVKKIVRELIEDIK